MKSTLTCTLLSLALAASATAQSRLTNVSVRSSAGSEAETLIVGFTVGGLGHKQMLVRAVGPTLGTFGVTGTVADPQLTLYNSAGTNLATNDDWGNQPALLTAHGVAGAFPLPATSRDAALVQSLAPGSYSAHVGVKGSGGVALVEAYDIGDVGAASQIINLSARSDAGAGARILTVGFAIAGNTPKTMLIRAIGPALRQFGTGNAHGDPELRLYRADGTFIAYNYDWLSLAGWGAVFESVGAFPLTPGSDDSALVIKLPPANYTAQAHGTNGTSGVALVEVYDVSQLPANTIVFTPLEGLPDSNATGVRVNPVVTRQGAPVYPIEMRRAGLNGEVLVEFTVNLQGVVQNAFPVRATNAAFIAPSIQAVSGWLFRAGTLDGKPVSFRMQVPIIYQLNG